MTNIVDIEKIPVMRHLDRLVNQCEDDIDRALQRLKHEALFSLAISGKLDHFEYETVKEAITKGIAQRELAHAATIKFLRQELHSACALQLPPSHVQQAELDHGKRYRRWSRT